jgi:type VII secretion effector (TIGR04197 family)
MNFSKLSYAQINSLAEQLKSSSTQMESLLNEIKTLFDKVGNDDVWSGTAASSTKENFDTLSAKFPEFSTAINDCYKYLISVVANYQAVDQSVSGQQ